MKSIFADPGWLRGLTLAERTGAGDDTRVDSDRELAEKRLERWRERARLDDPVLFAERLATAGLDRERFARLLVETPEELARRAGRPAWLRRLETAFAEAASTTVAETAETADAVADQPRAMPLGSVAGAESSELLEPVRPLMDHAYRRFRRHLRRRFEDVARPPFDLDDVAELMVDKLPAQLLFMVSRALVLELHVRRLEERLEGTTPRERFAHFVHALRRPEEALTVLLKYPLLARMIVLRLEQWHDVGLELLDRLARDRDEIARRFGDDDDPGTLVALETSLSDRHDGGRTVFRLGFASGLKLIYKPRSLAVDRVFQRLLAWLGARGLEPPPPVITVYDRGAYGWMEHVAARPCADHAGVERFYRRQGSYLALLYLLQATDFHHENVIADGENPILIDLETLFQPSLSDPPSPLHQTVLQSGLLPRRLWARDDFAGIDLTGLGGGAGQRAEVPDLVDVATDRMRYAKKTIEVPVGDHQPTLAGEEIDPGEMVDAILDGFRHAYRFLRRHRDALRAPGGPLDAFTEVEMRAILRATASYAQLIHAGYHPDVLRDALYRDRLFDRLWRMTADHPRRRELVAAELAQLTRGDVPRFACRPDSPDLRTADGSRIEGFFAATGGELVARRLAALDDDDLERQTWMIRAAWASTRPVDRRLAWSTRPLPEAADAVAPKRFLDAARRVAERLETLSFRSDDAASDVVGWFHLDVTRQGTWALEPTRVNLYSGLFGIALFFAQLGRVGGEERHASFACRVWRSATRRLDDDGALPTVGAFTGWGGHVYALTHLGLLWSEPAFLDEAAARVGGLAPLVEEDGELDLIGGAAGCLAALAALYRERPEPAVLAAARVCGDHLLARAVRSDRGWGWPLSAAAESPDTPPLVGLAHGTAGVAWSLYELHGLTGDERYREGARGALAYERSHFSAERDNWPDLRYGRHATDDAAYLHAWCHGAPGIGLSRLALLPRIDSRVDDDAIRAEIAAAIRSTLAAGFGQNHSLCHGDLGNLDLLLVAAETLGDATLRAEADRLAARILKQIETSGWRCGAHVGTELPGLMVGLAGIGYGLLRAASPETVPSVLLLETPSDRARRFRSATMAASTEPSSPASRP